jgi:hypothetical protein
MPETDRVLLLGSQPRRVHALAQTLRRAIAESAKARGEWTIEALVAHMRANGHVVIRVPVGGLFTAAADRLDVEVTVDDDRGEVVFTLVDEAGEPVPAGPSAAAPDPDRQARLPVGGGR